MKGEEGEREEKSYLTPLAVAPRRRGSARVARGEGPREKRAPQQHRDELYTGHGKARSSTSSAKPGARRNPSLGLGRARLRQAGKNKSPWRGRRRTGGVSIPPQHGGEAGRSTPGMAGDGRGEHGLEEEGEKEGNG